MLPGFADLFEAVFLNDPLADLVSYEDIHDAFALELFCEGDEVFVKGVCDALISVFRKDGELLAEDVAFGRERELVDADEFSSDANAEEGIACVHLTQDFLLAHRTLTTPLLRILVCPRPDLTVDTGNLRSVLPAELLNFMHKHHLFPAPPSTNSHASTFSHFYFYTSTPLSHLFLRLHCSRLKEKCFNFGAKIK